MSAVSTPLPYKPLVILCIARFGEPVAATVLLPFLYFLVRDHLLPPNASPGDIGKSVASIASAFALAQFASAMFWAPLSDKVGRRPVVLLGLLGSALFTLLFGISESFYWALSMRILAGLVNGNVGVVKSMVAELTDSTNEARGFSLLPLTWGLGCALGPIIGGTLSNPASRYPNSWLAQIPAFQRYPYLLPCAVASAITFSSFLLALLFLEETLDTSLKGLVRQRRASQARGELCAPPRPSRPSSCSSQNTLVEEDSDSSSSGSSSSSESQPLLSQHLSSITLRRVSLTLPSTPSHHAKEKSQNDAKMGKGHTRVDKTFRKGQSENREQPIEE